MAADVSLLMSSRCALPYGTALAAEQDGSFRVLPVGFGSVPQVRNLSSEL